MTLSTWRRSLRQMDSVIGPVRDRLAPETLLAEVQRRWRDAVGEEIAAQASPTAERAGVVTVSCAASVWAQELDLMAPQLIAALNRELAGERILRLRCVVGELL